MTTKDMTLSVLSTRTGERSVELPIVHLTEDGMYAVLDGRNRPDHMGPSFPTYHFHSGKRVPGNDESSRTKHKAIRFANEFAAADFFDTEGHPRAHISSKARSEIVKWVREWDA